MDSAQSTLQIVLEAKDEASSTLEGFGSSLSEIMGVAAGFDLANVVNQILDAGKAAIDSAIQFEAMTTSLGTILGNVSSGGQQAEDAFGGSSGHIINIAEKTADEMHQYSEKIAKIQTDLKDALAGQN